MAKNRCPKCDCDRFLTELKDKRDPHSAELVFVYTDKDGKEVKSPVEDGMEFVVCAWCKNKVLFVDPTKNKPAAEPAGVSSLK